MSQRFYSIKGDPTGNTPGIQDTVHFLEVGDVVIDCPKGYTVCELLDKIDNLRQQLGFAKSPENSNLLREMAAYCYIASFYISNNDENIKIYITW